MTNNMALKPIITRLDVHEYIYNRFITRKKNSALKLVLNTFNVVKHNVEIQVAVADIKKCLALQIFNRKNK
jgi:hypothetical protein